MAALHAPTARCDRRARRESNRYRRRPLPVHRCIRVVDPDEAAPVPPRYVLAQVPLTADNLVAEAVIALKTVILALPASVLADANTPTPARLVARLARQLPTVSNPRARASIFWLVGQYAESDTPPNMGIGWEGVQPWVPDVLRLAIKGFKEEVRF